MFLVSERKRNINPLLVAIDIWGFGLNSITIVLNEKGPQKISTTIVFIKPFYLFLSLNFLILI